jgi:hypothetical protein
MFVEVRHKGKMVFFREGADIRAILGEAVAAGIDLSPGNIIDEGSKVYGKDLPKGDYSEDALAKAKILLLRIEVRDYADPVPQG